MVLAEYCKPHFASHVPKLTRGLRAYARSRLRLCFASPSHEQLREGVAVLAEVCRREFGVPTGIANVERQANTRSWRFFDLKR